MQAALKKRTIFSKQHNTETISKRLSVNVLLNGAIFGYDSELRKKDEEVESDSDKKSKCIKWSKLLLMVDFSYYSLTNIFRKTKSKQSPTSVQCEEIWEADDEGEDHEDEEFSQCCSCHGCTIRSHTQTYSPWQRHDLGLVLSTSFSWVLKQTRVFRPSITEMFGRSLPRYYHIRLAEAGHNAERTALPFALPVFF